MKARLLLKISAAVGLVACFAVGDAKADVKVVSTVNVTGMMMRQNADPSVPPPFPQTVTVYYKGPDARVESSNGEVKIFKGATGNVYSILPAKKIYFVRSLAQEVSGGFGGGRFGGGNFKPDVTVTIASDATASAKTLGGMSASRNTVSGTFTMPSFGNRNRNRGGNGGPGGNGGGAPGAGGGNPANPPPTPVLEQGTAPRPRLALEGVSGDVQDAQDNTTPPATPPAAPPARVMKLDGEVWTSSGVSLPDDPKASALPSLITLGQSFTLFMTPLSDSITKNKMVPLDVKLSFTRPSRNPDAPAPTPTVGTITTKSIATASLDASLFTVPADYTQVDPPAPQWGGGRNRGGGGPGGNGGGPGGNAAPGGANPAPAPPAD